MHYLVKMLVTADNAKEALEEAYTDCETMVEQGIIDWFDMNGRWGESKAYSVKTKAGQKLIREAMDCNRKEFDRALEAIRYMFENYTDDQIYNEEFTKTDQKESEHYLSRYQFTIASGRTNAAALYAMGYELWGSRVENDKDLEHILENNKDKKLWVVPVDVHN
jgi:hypothetical protein